MNVKGEHPSVVTQPGLQSELVIYVCFVYLLNYYYSFSTLGVTTLKINLSRMRAVINNSMSLTIYTISIYHVCYYVVFYILAQLHRLVQPIRSKIYSQKSRYILAGFSNSYHSWLLNQLFISTHKIILKSVFCTRLHYTIINTYINISINTTNNI